MKLMQCFVPLCLSLSTFADPPVFKGLPLESESANDLVVYEFVTGPRINVASSGQQIILMRISSSVSNAQVRVTLAGQNISNAIEWTKTPVDEQGARQAFLVLKTEPGNQALLVEATDGHLIDKDQFQIATQSNEVKMISGAVLASPPSKQ